MPRIHSPLVRLSNKYKIYFDRFEDRVFPYKHVALIIEIGDSTIFRTVGTSKEQCKVLMLAIIPDLVKSIEFLETAKFDENSY
jgi:hypothetical protein